MSQTIKVTASSIDGFRQTKSFKTLKGAQAFAIARVGPSPEIGMIGNYAVSADGVVKVTAEGISLADLFKKNEPAKLKGAARFDADERCMNCIEGEFDGEVTYQGRICDECKAEHAIWLKQDAERKAAQQAARDANRDPNDILF